jgi:drug/metabolite transporter (DMT)-like permease
VSTPRLLPVAALAFNALIWGLSWWPLRTLHAAGLHPLWTTACVFTTAWMGITLWRPQAWQGLNEHPELWWLLVASGLTNVGFNWAVTTGDVVRVVLLFYLMPTWSLLLAWWLLGERPTPAALARMGLALVGVALVLKTPEVDWPVPQTLPDVLALLAGACFALTNVLLLRLQHTPEASRMVAMFGGGALMAVLCAVAAQASGIVGEWVWDIGAWWPWALLLTVSFLLGNLALQYGAARLNAHTTAMVMLSEVVFATASSVSLGASTLTWRIALGGGLIVLAALLASQASGHASHP